MSLNLPWLSWMVPGARAQAQLPQAGQRASQWFCVSGDMCLQGECSTDELKTGSGQCKPSPGPLHLLACHPSVSDRHMCVLPLQINRRVGHLVPKPVAVLPAG